MKKLSILLLFACLLIQTLFAQEKQTVAILISSESENARILIRSYLTKEISKLSSVRLVSPPKNAQFHVNIIAIQNNNQYYFSSAITENIVIKNKKIEKYWTSGLFVTPSESIQSSCKSIINELKESVETSSMLKRMDRIIGQ